MPRTPSSRIAYAFPKLSLRWLLWCLLLGLTVYGCGSSFVDGPSASGSGPGTNPGAGAPPPPPPAGTVLQGRILVMPFVSLVDGDPEILALIEGSRAVLEARGMVLEQNILTWPRLPAHGWIVKVQDETVLCDENGVFSLTVPESSGSTLTLIHPSVDLEANLGAVPIEVSLAEFGTDPSQPTTLVVPLGFDGPCGMSEDDTEELCGPPVVASRARSKVLGQYIPPDWVEPAKPEAGSVGVVRDRLGTYPPPFQFVRGGCPDTDGPASLAIKDPTQPFFDLPNLVDLAAFLSGRTRGELITYVGSTCDLNILEGACANENTLSDVEYRTVRPALEALAAARGLKLSPPAGRPPEWGSLPCKENHKSRLCGMFLKGDVALDVDSTVVKAGQTHSLRVERGQTGSFTVHNNGVYGITDIRIGGPTVAELVTFSGAPMSRLNLKTHRLRHFDRLQGVPYAADRVLDFRISQTAEEGDEIPVTFTVDQNKVTLIFKVGPGLDVAPSFVNLRSGDLERFEALSGSTTDPPGRTFEWSLANATGTLSSKTGKIINFRAAVIEDEVVFDTLTVRMFDRDPLGNRQETGKATAAIRISRTGVGITPPSVSLTPGDSQQFEVITTLAPDAVLSYQWETSSAGHGTLSSLTQPTVLYTVKDDVQPPQTDTVKVTVFVGEGAARTKLGESTATISIVSPAGAIPAALLGGSQGMGDTELQIWGASFQPATGQLTIKEPPLVYLQSGIVPVFGERVALRPSLGHGYISYTAPTPERERVIEGFRVDPATGALSAGSPLGSSGFHMVMSNSKLYVEALSEVLRFTLDSNGGATQDSFSLPSTSSAGLLLLRDANGDETVLYRYTNNGVEGHRVGPGLAVPEQVAGSPWPIEFPIEVGMVLHPNKRFLVVASQGFSDTRARLECLEIDPETGAILGQRGEIVENDIHFPFPMVMTGDGLVVVQFVSGLSGLQVISVGTDGSLSKAAVTPSSGRLLAASPSGNFVFELGGTGPDFTLNTYQVSSSGANLTDTDPTTANLGIFLAPAP